MDPENYTPVELIAFGHSPTDGGDSGFSQLRIFMPRHREDLRGFLYHQERGNSASALRLVDQSWKHMAERSLPPTEAAMAHASLSPYPLSS
jgi:hypothetical protein